MSIKRIVCFFIFIQCMGCDKISNDATNLLCTTVEMSSKACVEKIVDKM